MKFLITGSQEDKVDDYCTAVNKNLVDTGNYYQGADYLAFVLRMGLISLLLDRPAAFH